jgi:hypothetical protein
MATITIKIHKSTKKTQALISLVRELSKTDKNIEIEETGSPYNQEFVKKVQRSLVSEGKAIKTEDLWK